MKLDRALGISVRLVALSGVLSLLLTLESPLWLVVPALLFIIGGMVRPEAFSRFTLSGRAQSVAAVGALGFAVVDFFFIGGSLVSAAADFLMLLVCLKLLSPGTRDDYVQLIGAGLFLLLSSTGLSTEIFFVLPFLLFFVSSAWSMMLLTIKTESVEKAARTAGWSFGYGFFGSTAGLTVSALIATLVIFFSIPRVGIGFFSKRAGGLIRTSGFSDTVELGSVGEVKLDPGTVMRIELKGYSAMPDFPLYWRGRTFDRYESDRWRDTREDVRAEYRAGLGNFALRNLGRDRPRTVEQTISLEPLDTTTIFALYPAYWLNSNFRMLNVDPSGGLRLPRVPGERLSYKVVSAIPPQVGEPSQWGGARSTERSGEMMREKYLQLPEGSERLAALSAEVTKDGAGSLDKARAVESYLGRTCAYTLDPERDTDLSPMDDFLFRSRQGFCEHFATAMVLMLRASGVHARLVAGYAGGEWNNMGNYIIVRERDAHTWVEVYDQGYGWVTFDPTPPAPVSQFSEISAAVTGFMDYLKYEWDRRIVYFNMRDQMAALGAASDTFYDIRYSLGQAASEISGALLGGKKRGRSGLGYLYIAAIVAILAGLGAGGYVLLRIRRRGGLGAGTVWLYAELEHALRKKGFTRASGETPMEFADRAGRESGGALLRASYVVRAYYRIRYGGLRLTDAEKTKVRDAIDAIRTFRGRA